MKRRNFLRNISAVSAAPLVIGGLPISTFASPSMLSMLNCQGIDERVLVVIFLKGGNDGINTLVPINQYDNYVGHRPDIHLNNSGANAIIQLDSGLPLADQIGLNPNMTAFKEMYDNGQAALVQGVGYPDINQSHFKSTDLWLTGGDGLPVNFNLNSGWIGRYFDTAYPGVFGTPQTDFPDPLGIQLGDPKPSISFHDHASEYLASNLGWQYPGDLSGLLNGLGTAPHQTMLNSDYGAEIEYIMNVENNTNAYGERITQVFNNGSNSAVTYPDSGLGYQLSSIARMLSGGSQTKLFLVHAFGFDTHAGQVEAGATHTGWHAGLLADLFDSIKAFTTDLTNLGIEDKVVTSTFSEFGRRVTQNGSLGTDHGLLAPMFLFGSAINPGVIGTNLDLSNLDNNGNVIEAAQQDYRAVFKTLLQDWLGGDNIIMDGTGFGSFSKIDALIAPTVKVDPSCYISPLAPLPVTLIDFEVEKIGASKALITWQTTDENLLSHYEIERSGDGRDFEKIDEQTIDNSEANLHEYEIIDREPLPNTSYYRLKSIDLDGSVNYSEIRSIQFKQSNIEHLRIYPNPAVYDTNIVLTTKHSGALNIQLVNSSAQEVKSLSFNLQSGFNKFNIPVQDLSPGMYFINIIGDQIEESGLKLLVEGR